MGWRDDDDDDFDIGRARPRTRSRAGSSAYGMTSFVIAMLNGLFLFGVFFFAVMVNINQNAPLPDDDPRMVLLGLGFLAGMAFAVLGLILGFAGLGQSNGIVFAILGIIFNGLVLIGVLGLLALGLAVGG